MNQIEIHILITIIFLFIYMDTNNYGLKVLAQIFGQISLPQCPRQETFWASAGFESTEESVTGKLCKKDLRITLRN